MISNTMFENNPGGKRLFEVQLAFLILGWIFILLRAWVKIVMIKKVTLDDYLMFAAILLYTAYGVIALQGIVDGGTGKHAMDLNLAGAAIALRGWWLCEVLYAPIILLVRTSVAVFLNRIATNKVHKWIIWVDMAIIWVVTVAFFFFLVFQCSPVSYFWMQLLGAKGSCMDRRVVPAVTIIHSALSAVSDWILGLLPIAMLWNVRLNKRTKITISFLLSLGLLAGVALIVRIPYVRILEVSVDFLFETIDVAIWSVMEPSLGIIAGCAATLRPLFKTWGLGPRSTDRNVYRYERRPYNRSKLNWPSASSRQYKFSEDPSSTSKSAGRDEFVDNHSEVELTISSAKRRTHGDWDPENLTPLPPLCGINVHTSIDVSSRPLEERPRQSDSSSERELPLQGERIDRVKTPPPVYIDM